MVGYNIFFLNLGPVSVRVEKIDGENINLIFFIFRKESLKTRRRNSEECTSLSVADPGHSDADPEPTFIVDADPNFILC